MFLQQKSPEESRLKSSGHRWQPGTADYVPPARGWAVVEEDEVEGDLFERVQLGSGWRPTGLGSLCLVRVVSFV